MARDSLSDDMSHYIGAELVKQKGPWVPTPRWVRLWRWWSPWRRQRWTWDSEITGVVWPYWEYSDNLFWMRD